MNLYFFKREDLIKVYELRPCLVPILRELYRNEIPEQAFFWLH